MKINVKHVVLLSLAMGSLSFGLVQADNPEVNVDNSSVGGGGTIIGTGGPAIIPGMGYPGSIPGIGYPGALPGGDSIIPGMGIPGMNIPPVITPHIRYLKANADDPLQKTVDTGSEFPSVLKYKNATVDAQHNITSTVVSGQYSVHGNLRLSPGAIFNGKPGTLFVRDHVNIEGDVVLWEQSQAGHPGEADPQNWGIITLSHQDTADKTTHIPPNRTLMTVKGDWIGGNKAPAAVANLYGADGLGISSDPDPSKIPADGDAPKLEADTHQIGLYSTWNKLDKDTDTNTGLDSDLITIDGNVYGYTRVVSQIDEGNGHYKLVKSSTIDDHTGQTYYALSDREVDGKTTAGAPLITVKGKSQYKNSFFGTLPIADGHIAYLIPYDNGKTGKDNVHGFTWGWYYQAPKPQSDGTLTPPGGHRPAANPTVPAGGSQAGNPNQPTTSQPSTSHGVTITRESFAPNTPGILMAPKATEGAAAALLDTLHQRVGQEIYEGFTEDVQGAHKPIWARYIGHRADLDYSAQLSQKSRIQGLQVGLKLKEKNREYRTDSGEVRQVHKERFLTVGMVHNTSSYIDRYSVPLDSPDGITGLGSREVGQGNTDLYSVGFTATNYQVENKTYQDWVAQYFFGTSKAYTPAYTHEDSAHVYGYGLSYETGKVLRRGTPLTERGRHWTLEGQAQLAYLRLHTNDYESANQLKVHSGWADSLVGRLGLRYYRHFTNEKNSNAPYFVLNLHHNFMDDNAVQIGNRTYRGDYMKTWFDIGLGGQHYFKKTAYLYGDARYEHSLGSAHGHGWDLRLGLHWLY